MKRQKKGDTPAPPKRKIVLTKVRHVRSELGRLYSEARNGKIDVTDASKLGNLLQILSRIIVDDTLEARIEALEKGSNHNGE